MVDDMSSSMFVTCLVVGLPAVLVVMSSPSGSTPLLICSLTQCQRLRLRGCWPVGSAARRARRTAMCSAPVCLVTSRFRRRLRCSPSSWRARSSLRSAPMPLRRAARCPPWSRRRWRSSWPGRIVSVRAGDRAGGRDRVRLRSPAGRGIVGGLPHPCPATTLAQRARCVRKRAVLMSNAAMYARVSSARQKEQETIRSQTAALRTHAEQLGLDVPEQWVFEDDGHSGASLVRPALERLRDLVCQVPVDVLLVFSPDRLARKYAYQALLIEEFAKAGTSVVFVKGPRGDSPEDALLMQFQGMIAEYEHAQILERTRRGKTHRARAGTINVLSGAPFGYRYVRKSEHAEARYEIVVTRRRSSPNCSPATPRAASRSANWPAGWTGWAWPPAPARPAGTARRCGGCCATPPTPGGPASARQRAPSRPPHSTAPRAWPGVSRHGTTASPTGPAKTGWRSRCRRWSAR